jgi:hypothetical protein
VCVCVCVSACTHVCSYACLRAHVHLWITSSHWIGGGMDPRAGVGAVEKKQMFTFAGSRI